MRLLDLFCGQGGAAMGYHRAGFADITGVDHKPQPRYPFAFVQGDALEYLKTHWREYDAIHASPPCQRFTAFQYSQPQRKNRHVDLIAETRSALETTDRLWVIENVEGSPLQNPVRCCGTAFNLAVPARGQLLRHRLFESNAAIVGTGCKHTGPSVMVCGHGRDGYRGNGLAADDARTVMQMPWASRDGVAQAVPPAYTEYLGRQLLAALTAHAEAGRQEPPNG